MCKIKSLTSEKCFSGYKNLSKTDKVNIQVLKYMYKCTVDD